MAENIKRGEVVRVDVFPAPMGEKGWRARAESKGGAIAAFPVEGDSLAGAIEASIDFFGLTAHRDDFGVDKREGWAMWERVEDGYSLTLTTKDGLTVCNLDPLASKLQAVAGPAGFKASDIDPDDLPEGFRWVTAEELAELVSDGI